MATLTVSANVCWHDDQLPRGHRCDGYSAEDGMLFYYGRCRSGRRWFWSATCHDWRGLGHDNDERHEHGWADAEDQALAEARASIERLASGRPAVATMRHGFASSRLKLVNAAKRAARPPSTAAHTSAVEYLYAPCVSIPYDDYLAETRRWVQEVPIVKKTAKRIYYDISDNWDKHEGVVTLGFIDREAFERDGKIRIPGDYLRLDGHEFYTTRQAAEDELYRWEREHPKADIKALRKAMADAHPDRGGTDEEFIAARERYEQALGRRAS